MTRTSRSILVMALMSIGGVAALGWMAQRYGDALSRRPAAAPRGSAVPSAGELPTADVDRLVEAYVGVRRALARSGIVNPGDGRSGGEIRRAVASHGLTYEQYRSLEILERDWRAGSPAVPAAYRAALERLRDRLPAAGR